MATSQDPRLKAAIPLSRRASGAGRRTIVSEGLTRGPHSLVYGYLAFWAAGMATEQRRECH